MKGQAMIDEQLQQLADANGAQLERVAEGFRHVAEVMLEQGRQVVDSILEWQQQTEPARRHEFPGSRPAWQRRR